MLKKRVRAVNNLPDFKDESGCWVTSYTVTTESEYIQNRTVSFNLWPSINNRCKVDGSQQLRSPNYVGTLNLFTDFQQFAEWCQHQEGYGNVDALGNRWQIDKDLFGEHYCPTTCVFMPAALNTLLSKGLGKGVTVDDGGSRNKKYSVRYFKYKEGYTGRARFYSEVEARQAWLDNRDESFIIASKDEELSARIRTKLRRDTWLLH